MFLMLLFTGGLQHPIPAAMGGAVWIASRVVYSLGYYTGSKGKSMLATFISLFNQFCLLFLDPKKIMRGSFGYFGLFVLLGTSGIFGAKLLGCY